MLMAELKLGAITDEKPVKLTVELSAGVHRDLLAYTEALARQSGQSIGDPVKLIAPMLARFMLRIEHLQKSAVRVNFPDRARDSARKAASGRLPRRDSHCRLASKLNSPIGLAQRHHAAPDTPNQRNWRRRLIPEQG